MIETTVLRDEKEGTSTYVIGLTATEEEWQAITKWYGGIVERVRKKFTDDAPDHEIIEKFQRLHSAMSLWKANIPRARENPYHSEVQG